MYSLRPLTATLSFVVCNSSVYLALQAGHVSRGNPLVLDAWISCQASGI